MAEAKKSGRVPLKPPLEELSGSSHMTSKIIDPQNELSSNVRFAIPKTDAEVMQAQHSSVPETMAKSTKWDSQHLENVEPK